MTVVGRTFPRGRYGTLRPITPLKTSGRKSAACHATGAPQSCPAITADVSPSAPTSPTMSPTRCRRVEAGAGERVELVAPGVPGFGKAVTHDDERPHPLLGHVHADAVRLDRAVLELAHGRFPSWPGALPRAAFGSRMTASTRCTRSGS